MRPYKRIQFYEFWGIQKLYTWCCVNFSFRLLLSYFAANIALSGVALTSFPRIAHAMPFSCSGDIFQVQSGQLRIFDPIISSYVNVGAPNGSYNAVGYNILDNFAYGSQGNTVIRVAADGVLTTLYTGNADYNSRG